MEFFEGNIYKNCRGILRRSLNLFGTFFGANENVILVLIFAQLVF